MHSLLPVHVNTTDKVEDNLPARQADLRKALAKKAKEAWSSHYMCMMYMQLNLDKKFTKIFHYA